jgi:anion-transporting  ArsA/GET3 family ATPase
MIETTVLEFFCGTGGVGKTSLSLSRASYLAEKGHKTLLITIDPSLRLKDFLKLETKDKGDIKHLNIDQFSLDVLLMDAQESFTRISKVERHFTKNRILDILTKPHGGLLEVLSMIEISNLFQSRKYEYIVVDTAPGGHFVDFLDSCEKVNNFFEQSFIEFFSTKNKNQSPGFFKKVVNFGLDKLLSQLERVTDKEFIGEFIETIQLIYRLKEAFIKALDLVQYLSNDKTTHWFFVTSTEQAKTEEAVEIHKKSERFHSDSQILLINKSNKERLDRDLKLNLDATSKSILSYYQNKENIVTETLSGIFDKIMLFEEADSDNPGEFVKQLSQTWNSYDL